MAAGEEYHDRGSGSSDWHGTWRCRQDSGKDWHAGALWWSAQDTWQRQAVAAVAVPQTPAALVAMPFGDAKPLLHTLARPLPRIVINVAVLEVQHSHPERELVHRLHDLEPLFELLLR